VIQARSNLGTLPWAIFRRSSGGNPGNPRNSLVTWKQLIGDRRLSGALAECDARGWDALPLAAKKLCWLFPRLWDTEKAAEHWAREESPRGL